MTLLKIVQRTLDAMNHDSVNTIAATPESQQIAEEARVVYYDLMDRDDWPHLRKLIQLEAVSDVTRPNFLRIPDNVARIDDVRYEVTGSDDDHRTFDRIRYCEPTDFLEYTYTRRSDLDNVIVVDTHDNVPMFIQNDQRPQFWTTFDDEHLVFDAFDNTVDSTLQASKSQVRGKVIPEWVHEDSFVPEMPEQMFSVYLAEVTAASFMYWKQAASPKDEQRLSRGISRLRKDARKVDESDLRAKFGRRRPRVVRTADGHRGSILFR